MTTLVVTTRNHQRPLFMSVQIPVVRRYNRRVRKVVTRGYRALLLRDQIRPLRNDSSLNSVARATVNVVDLAIFLRGVHAK